MSNQFHVCPYCWQLNPMDLLKLPQLKNCGLCTIRRAGAGGFSLPLPQHRLTGAQEMTASPMQYVLQGENQVLKGGCIAEFVP